MGRWKRRRRPPGGSADRGGAAPLPAGLGGAAAPEERCAPWTARRGAGRPAARARGLAPPVRPVGSGTPAARHGRPVLRRLTAAAPQRGSTCRRLPGLSRSLGRCGSAQRCAAPPPSVAGRCPRSVPAHCVRCLLLSGPPRFLGAAYRSAGCRAAGVWEGIGRQGVRCRRTRESV